MHQGSIVYMRCQRLQSFRRREWQLRQVDMIDSPTRCIERRNIAHGTWHASNESKQAGEKLRVRQMVCLERTSKNCAHRKRCLIKVV